MNKNVKSIFDIAWFLVVFILLQFISIYVVRFVGTLISTHEWGVAFSSLSDNAVSMSDIQLILVFALSSLLTIIIFVWCRWSPYSREWIATKPWFVFFWVIVLMLGTFFPSLWLSDLMGVDMPQEQKQMFAGMLNRPEGYMVLGLLAPLAEEMVFRGAILRTLLNMFNRRRHWIPIVISALLFGLVHGNAGQFVHALLIGILLGWMYYRTDSIVPGVVFHWTNNTLVYIIYRLMPGMEDVPLKTLLGGSDKAVVLSLVFSMCIFLPALYQLAVRLKRSKE